MIYSKSIVATTMLASFFSLGCGVLPPPTSVECELKCTVDTQGVQKCEPKCKVIWDSAADAAQWAYYVDPVQLAINTQQSTVPITSFFGPGTMTSLDVNNNIVTNGGFQWNRSGSNLLISNPAVVVQAINQAAGQATQIEYSFDNVGINSTTGMNTFNAQHNYIGQGFASSQESWFCTSAGGGPIGQQNATIGSCF